MTIASFATSIMLKPGLVVVGALILTWFLRHRSAAARHAMWTGSFIAIAALPLLTSVVPALRIGTSPDAALARLVQQVVSSNGPRITQTSPVGTLSSGMASGVGARTGTTSVALGDIVVYAWAAIALILVARRLVAERLVRRLVARGRSPSAALLERFAHILRTRGIRRSVTLTMSDETASPAAVGIFRPVVILPAGVERLTDAEITSVLIHELSHVTRHDCTMNLIADLAVAIHWCNPLLHVAARRMRADGERACDDEVLHAGGEAEGYAMLLLAFARAARLSPPLPRSAQAMARPSELESRVMAILDSRITRTPLRKFITRGLAAVSIVFAMPIAATTLNASLLPAPQIPPSTLPLNPRPSPLIGPEPDGVGDSLSAQSSERIPAVLDEAAVRAAEQRARTGPDAALAAILLAAVINPPNDAHSLVRERAAWALLQTREDQLLQPVLEALASPDWRVQAYAAWTLGVAGDHRAVPQLITLVQHPVWRMRAMAAAVLRQLADARGAGVMTAALTDQAWQVRLEAVEYLAALGDSSLRERLRERLDDRHIAVRHAAARALRIF